MATKDKGIAAWSELLSTHALALGTIEATLKAAGQPPLAWYDVLLELERAGGDLRIGDLAERLVIERYNMTRLLDRMAAEGLVERVPDARDRRSARAVLSPSGRTQRAAMWPHYRSAIAAAFADALSAEDAAALTAILRKVKARLRGA